MGIFVEDFLKNKLKQEIVKSYITKIKQSGYKQFRPSLIYICFFYKKKITKNLPLVFLFEMFADDLNFSISVSASSILHNAFSSSANIFFRTP